MIEVDLAGKLALAVGFRNILVHQYLAVDDDVVLHAGERLDEFTAFVAQVSSWLTEQRS